MEGLKPQDDRAKLSAFERIIVIASAFVSLALFGYLAWEAATTPNDPQPEVAVEAAAEGAWVALRNTGGAGIATAHVSATCGEEASDLEFTNVPADSERRAFVPCDGPVEATLAWWTPT